MAPKYVYNFGSTGTDGNASQRNLLGGKGANLAEMCNLVLPVPAGFTITTECCTAYFAEGGQFPPGMKEEVQAALKKTEAAMGMKYGAPENPLLVSSRSGARSSMPGMMETVLNVGLCSATIPGLIKKSGSERFVYDAYRRLITMYSDVVMEKAEGIEPAEGQGVRVQLEHLMDAMKKARGVTEDTELSAEDLKALCDQYKAKVKEVLGREFPDDAMEQLWGASARVFKSWNGKRAVPTAASRHSRRLRGTAVNVQSMVFGNMGDTSATGVAFSRNPATGENKFYGEWLVNAQGEDVVAGIRTPNPLNKGTKNDQNRHLASLETEWPESYRELVAIRDKLEQHYRDMQDIEFTIQEGKLYMLQCRNGKRTGTAALNMAMEMLDEGLIDESIAVTRVAGRSLTSCCTRLWTRRPRRAPRCSPGFARRPGRACGEIVYTSDGGGRTRPAESASSSAKRPTPRTSRRDARPKAFSPPAAASTTPRWSPAVGASAASSARANEINISAGTMTAGGKTLKAGDVITLNGTRGLVYQGR